MGPSPLPWHLPGNDAVFPTGNPKRRCPNCLWVEPSYASHIGANFGPDTVATLLTKAKKHGALPLLKQEPPDLAAIPLVEKAANNQNGSQPQEGRHPKLPFQGDYVVGEELDYRDHQ